MGKILVSLPVYECNCLLTISRHDMTFELNKFADRTEDEFRNTILMRPQAPPMHPPSKYVRAVFLSLEPGILP